MLCMREWVSIWRTCPVLSLGVPFYRPRGGTGLHGGRASVDHGVGKRAGQLETSVPVWFDGSCSSVLGDDDVCVSLREILYNTWPVLIHTFTQLFKCTVGSCWSADQPWKVLACGAPSGLEVPADPARSVQGSVDNDTSRGRLTERYAERGSTTLYLFQTPRLSW